MSPRRALAAWLPVAVVVPAVLVAAVGASRVEDPADAMDVVAPLEPGTTWVYAVLDHGEPSGRRTRQVLGPSQLVVDAQLRDIVRLSSVYDSYPGQGYQSSDAYLSVEDDRLLQHGLIVGGRTYDIVPPAPAYVLPREVGGTFSYDGTVADSPYVSSSEYVEIGDVEVRGTTFEDCVQSITEVEVQGGEEGEVEVQTDWACPDVGTVLFRLVNETRDTDITEELVRFRSPGRSLDLGDLPAPVEGAEVPEGGDEPTATGFDQRRSFAVPDGSLGRDLAWSDVRDVAAVFPLVSDGRTQVLGESDGTVTARDEVTGELRWQVSLTPPIVAAPAVHDGVVLVADAAKALWALSLTDGSAQWVHTFDDVVGASPAVVDDRVVVPVEDATVVALDAEDGDEVWSTSLAGRVVRSPASDDDVVVVADSAGALTALDVDDGDALWSADLNLGVDMGPTLADGTVVVSDLDGVISGYDLDDGRLRWQRRGRSFSTQSFAVSGDTGVMVSDNDDVEAFDLGDGERLWASRLEDLDTEPVVVGDEVLAMSEDGRATVLDLADGDVVDTWRLPRPPGARVVIDGAPALVAGAVVYRAQVTSAGIRYAYYAYPVTDERLPRGVSYDVESYPVPFVPVVPPVVDDGTLYAMTFEDVVLRSRPPADVAPVMSVEGGSIGLAASGGVLVVPSGEQTLGVDARTGEQLWALDTGESFVGSVPAADDDTAFIPVRDVGLIAADLRTGQARWAVPAEGAAGSSQPLPLPGGDVLYAGSGLTRHDGATGDVVWSLGGDLADAVSYTPISADDRNAYALLVSADPTAVSGERTRLVAADLRTGAVRWQRDVASGQFGIGPAAGDGVVVNTDATNLVTAHDSRTGDALWTFRTASLPGSVPVVSRGVVHLVERGRTEDIAARTFRVVTLDARTGRFLGSYEPPGNTDVPRPNSGPGPGGQLLVPTVSFTGGLVLGLEARR